MSSGSGSFQRWLRDFLRRYSHFGSPLFLFIVHWLGFILPVSGFIDVGSPPALSSFDRFNSLLSLFCIARFEWRLLVYYFGDVGPSLPLTSFRRFGSLLLVFGLARPDPFLSMFSVALLESSLTVADIIDAGSSIFPDAILALTWISAHPNGISYAYGCRY